MESKKIIWLQPSTEQSVLLCNVTADEMKITIRNLAQPSASTTHPQWLVVPMRGTRNPKKMNNLHFGIRRKIIFFSLPWWKFILYPSCFILLWTKHVTDFHKSVVTMHEVPTLFYGTVIHNFAVSMNTTGAISLKIWILAVWTMGKVENATWTIWTPPVVLWLYEQNGTDHAWKAIFFLYYFTSPLIHHRMSLL